MRWIIGGLAVAGTFHAVSAASAVLVSATRINGTVGTRLSYQIKVSDGQSRLAESWVVAGQVYGRTGSTTTGLPPGLSMSLSTGIISGVPTQAGTFNLPITAYEHPNLSGGQLSFTLTFTITGGTPPPTITTQPSGGTATEGGTFTFNVVANGTGSLSYQWQHGSTTISGATTPTLTLNPVQLTDGGTYTVTVSNGGGSVTSSPATLNVVAAASGPTVTQQPSDVTLHVGEPLTLNVAADGTRPLEYQWRHDGTPINGATSANFTLSSTSTSDAGRYDVVVSNPGGSVTSSTSTVTLVPLMVQVMGVSTYGTTLETSTIPGRQYTIEATTAVNGTWTTVTNLTAQTTSTTVVDSQKGDGQRYWRCRVSQ